GLRIHDNQIDTLRPELFPGIPEARRSLRKSESKNPTKEDPMNPKIALVLAVAALGAAALIPGGYAAASKANRASVAVAQSKLGRILVDGRGRSLYLFEKDKKGKSSCSGACLAYWP